MLYSFLIANQRGKEESIKFGKPGGNPHVLEWKILEIVCRIAGAEDTTKVIYSAYISAERGQRVDLDHFP